MVWTQIRLLLWEQSDQGPHCLPVCKNSFEKFERMFSRRHKQTTFSDAGFLAILRVKMVDLLPFVKGDNFCNFLFAFLYTDHLLKKSRHAFYSTFRPLFQKGAKSSLSELSPLKVL